jgi:Tfp pilus assembly protein PilE
MMRTPTAQPCGRPRLASRRAFTLLELGVVASVTLLLMALGAFAYTGVLKGQQSNSGRTMLDTGRVEGRRVAATNGYQFPADLATRLKARSAVTAKTTGSKFEFVNGPSYMPGTANNKTNTHRISVATDGMNVVAYTVQTAGNDTSGNCWVLVEDLSDTEGSTTRWGKVESIAAGSCEAKRPALCPRMVKGTIEKPTALRTLRSCPAK